MKTIYSIINLKSGKEKRVTKDKLIDYIISFKPKYCTWFNTKKEVFIFINICKNRKFVITRGYKHAGIYDVWEYK